MLSDVRAQIATGSVGVPAAGAGGAAAIGDGDLAPPGAGGGGAAGINPFATVVDAALMLLDITRTTR